MEVMDHKDLKENLVLMAQLVIKANQALMDHKDQPEPTVLQSTKVPLRPKIQVLYGTTQKAADYTFIMITAGLMLVLQLLVHQAQVVLMEVKDHKAQVAQMVVMDQQVHKDHKAQVAQMVVMDQQVHKDHKAQVAQMVVMDQQVHKDQLAYKDRVAQ
jgi:hypothetical protein